MAGQEGDFDALLVKACFEEAKLHDLAMSQQQGVDRPGGEPTTPPPSEGIRQAHEHKVGNPGGWKALVRCFECGGTGPAERR